ncbi:copper homeostasis protein CutC [Flagellimonas algicola]|uniref:PF03932 family protein CutC n=1 Tax=Flagellimonas algicola TaxID=2583815 RepID=A0ABY2WIN9_9FLAO|nr:copper homeostasis protein CutC [Allomuricauda algicola]TMU54397.1 copper homeostasis protein CutC [Allomuricauda algicola]
MLVEVCANSLESALNAQEAGADRIELCSELGVGGITPSAGLIALVKEALKIPVHVLVRPRGGHFTFNDGEFRTMMQDIQVCKDLGVEGIVSGVLLPDFEMDVDRTQELIKASRPMRFTFHRAFDWVPNPRKSFEQLEAMGVDYVLTSGQETSSEVGLELLKELNSVSKGVKVIAGGGIKLENAEQFKSDGLSAIHLSGTSFGNPIALEGKISMNSNTHLREDQVAVTNLETVRQIVQRVK